MAKNGLELEFKGKVELWASDVSWVYMCVSPDRAGSVTGWGERAVIWRRIRKKKSRPAMEKRRKAENEKVEKVEEYVNKFGSRREKGDWRKGNAVANW